MEKKLTPLVEEEIVVGKKEAADVSMACPSPETNVAKMPQTTSPDDEGKVLALMNFQSSNHYYQDINEVVEETAHYSYQNCV